MFGSLAEKLFGQSRYARYALIVSLCQAFIATILESLVLALHTRAVNQISKDNLAIYAQGKSMIIYMVMFIVSQLFQLVLCTDAIYYQNTIQFIALSIFIACGFAFSLTQVYQSTSSMFDGIGQQTNLPKDAVPYEIAIIVVMFVATISFTYLSYKLYQEFGWTIYKKIGADMEMRDRYKMYQIFIVLLKFDIFFFFGFAVQFLTLIVILDDTNEILRHIILSGITSIIVIVLGFWGVQTEKKYLMYLFMVGCGVGESYLIWRLVDVAQNVNNKYVGTKNFLSLFLGICLVLIIVTFLISIRCSRNFEKGLKYHLSRSQSLTSQVNGRETFNDNSREYSLETVNRNTQRWSID